jgi:NAD(P)H-dependent FMN reductase
MLALAHPSVPGSQDHQSNAKLGLIEIEELAVAFGPLTWCAVIRKLRPASPRRRARLPPTRASNELTTRHFSGWILVLTAVAAIPTFERIPMLKLKVIIGSTRPGRAADRVVSWIVDRAEIHGGFEVEVLDLREWPLPFFAENFQTVGDPRDPTYSDPIVRRWNQRIADGDVFIFVTPEYNHSVPGVLKNAIDSVFASFAFRNKVAAFVGYSGGIAAGARAIEHLAHIAIEAEMMPLRSSVLVPIVGTAFHDNGQPNNQAAQTAASIMLDDLQWWGTALRQAREASQLQPAAFRSMAAAGKAH